MTSFLPRPLPHILLTALLVVIAMAFVATHSAQAAEPKIIANYKDWSVYKVDLGGDMICYAISKPTEKSPRAVKHGDIFFLVSSWKSGVAVNQPSLMTGYELRAKPEPVVRIGSDKWKMFSSGSDGFIDKASDEQRLISAMKRGANMRVSAVSQRGTATSYTFSLLGVTDALKRVQKECR